MKTFSSFLEKIAFHHKARRFSLWLSYQLDHKLGLEDINWSKYDSSNKMGSVWRDSRKDKPNEKPGLLSWEKDQSKQGLSDKPEVATKRPRVYPHPAEALKAEQA